MSAASVSTFVDHITTTAAPENGKVLFSERDTMDVDQRPLPATHHPSTVISPSNDTTTPPTQASSSSVTQPSVVPSSSSEPPLPSEPTPVLDRPRKHESEGHVPGQTSTEKLAAPQPQMSHLSSNLISIFKLDPLAATVARFHPKSGEKINRMRKSYDNHLKTLGLSGKNRSIKHEEAIPSHVGTKLMGLNEMAAWPEEEWQNQKVMGGDIKNGLSDSTKAKLEKAFSINPGPVPDGPKWEDILGIDRPATDSSKPRKDARVNGQAVNGASAADPSQKAQSKDQGSEHIRARRNTKKRRYDDGSFEGYGEGYVDDDMDKEGYESGETYTSRNSRGSKGDRKRRKTQDMGKVSAGSGSRQGSFASGYGR